MQKPIFIPKCTPSFISWGSSIKPCTCGFIHLHLLQFGLQNLINDTWFLNVYKWSSWQVSTSNKTVRRACPIWSWLGTPCKPTVCIRASCAEICCAFNTSNEAKKARTGREHFQLSHVTGIPYTSTTLWRSARSLVAHQQF